ncbi:MAG: glycosyl hydrolase family 28-related protein [Opitutaceae bacterium]|nr:glycosyl hydrolase family 28-related protein [Opitutaceae bacterium]
MSLKIRHSLRWFWLSMICLAPVAGGPLPDGGAPAFDVRAFGAAGDGRTLDTGAINQAIEAAAAAGGGTVYFPAGIYASHSIRLRSNIALYLGPGATILAADPPPEGAAGGYDAPEPCPFDQYQDFGHSHWHNSLIWGENLENVSILGPGMIFGRGLSRGFGRKDPPPGEPQLPWPPELPPLKPGDPLPGPFGLPDARDALPAGVGNKAIALKNCRGVILRDFTIFHGGHFGILATGVDNFTIDNLKIDTNRDGIDVDCCRNVRISNCTVNSPNDDGICLKSSYGLDEIRATENVTIANCQVSGFEEGTLLDGTYQRRPPPRGPVGRIKFGTEANGGFKNITIANCVFVYSLGLALEEVDGGAMEDVTITNLAMREIPHAPIFIRLGARSRGPDHPPVGKARRILISNVVASDVMFFQGILISGIPGHAIEDVTLSNILIQFQGGGTAEQAARVVPELERDYPEAGNFGILPAYGLFARHVRGLSVRDVRFELLQDDRRPAVILDDVTGADFDHFQAPSATGVSALVLKNVTGLDVRHSPGLPDTCREQTVPEDRL